MTHSVVIHALMVLWYLRRRHSNPTCDFMMDLDSWRSPGMVEAVEEACEAPCLMKKLHKSPLTHTWCFIGPCTLEDDDVVIIDLMKTWNP